MFVFGHGHFLGRVYALRLKTGFVKLARKLYLVKLQDDSHILLTVASVLSMTKKGLFFTR